MVKMNVYGPEGEIRESVDLAKQEPLNDPNCLHPRDQVIEVDDNSGIKGVTAFQCQSCGIGWLVKNKER